MRQVVMEILQRDVMGDLEYRTNWIATSIKCGPLLGLFGTVLGMMAAFGRIGTGEKVEPSHDRRRNQHRADLHGDGPRHGHSVQFHAGQPHDADSQLAGCARRRPDARAGFLQEHDQLTDRRLDHARIRLQSRAPPAPDELMARRPDQEPPEFDITAMVDLVFMMNIYFLVTFVGAAWPSSICRRPSMSPRWMPTTAVILTVARSLDGKVGDALRGRRRQRRADQRSRRSRNSGFRPRSSRASRTAKRRVLLKAEKKVRLADLFRIAHWPRTAAKGVKLHVAVMEKDE